MESVVERGDRAFPASHLASDVVDALLRAAENSGAKVLCGKEVTEILRYTQDDSCHTERSEVSQKEGFTIKCSDGSSYSCRKLIICTGGLSYPKTGSTGDGYTWAAQMGHSIKTLFPSLTAIVPKGYKTESSTGALKGHIDRSTPLSETGKMLCGNQLKNVGLTLYIDGNTSQDEFGDLDFTDGGLEGPIGFKISRKCVNALVNRSKVSVSIDLKPAVDIEDLTVRINTLWNEVSKDRKTANKQYKERFRVLLTKLLPMSLIPGFVRLNPNVDHKTLAKALKNWKMEISGFVGYERCVITAGGISQEEVSPKTLESKLIPGLYFAGEVLDLDADTGGYNLQIAFSTGYLAGISAAKSL
jgi:predicted Rossmann fold flavoprotein